MEKYHDSNTGSNSKKRYCKTLLYATGNYDAMYFVSIIADPKTMTESDFDRWMDSAYFYMLSDDVVADIVQEGADKWLA